MGAYKYLEEVWRKKQTDAMRFLQRMRCWEYRQLPVHKGIVNGKPVNQGVGHLKPKRNLKNIAEEKVGRRRGGRKRPVHKGIVNGKPVNQGVGHLKPKRNLKNIAEEKVGRRCGGLRVLNSYWVNEDSV